MKHPIKSIKILLPVLITISLCSAAHAQSNDQPLKGHPINAPFSIIELLEPIALTSTDGAHAETFGFDIMKLQHANPALIRTETVWIQKGKNNQTAISKERVNYEQLIPVLVAALQQQKAEITELKVLLSKLQEQIAGDRKN